MVPLEINRKAPATASAEAVILAPLNAVWSILTEIDGWNRWNPDVSRVELRGPLTPGTEFHWRAGSGASIVSTLREVEPERRVAWTGRMLGIRAVHVWTFEEQDGSVLVRSEESFDGLIVRLFAGLMRRTLASSLQKGVRALKAECERSFKAESSQIPHSGGVAG
jgi:hypothetical protein